MQRQAQNREHDERAGQHQQMQPPMGEAAHHCLRRQPRALQEEQHGYGEGRQCIDDFGAPTRAGQNGRQRDDADQRHEERVGDEATEHGTLHGRGNCRPMHVKRGAWQAPGRSHVR